MQNSGLYAQIPKLSFELIEIIIKPSGFPDYFRLPFFKEKRFQKNYHFIAFYSHFYIFPQFSFL